ncbi:metalloprotease PmbA [Methylophaga sp. 42_25_T18]|nr:metalloprotease PmbA [Methylophaga sp. 42_25_T18]OUR88921.1 metalloprotease PmbA [Methylophaga sp. 42_8_T64]
MKTRMDNTPLEQAAEEALKQAKRMGAEAAEVGVSHSTGLSVTVRQGDIETLEHNNDTGLALTVYFGQSKASASTSDLRTEAIADMVKAACGIAKHTQADEFSGLAGAELMATEFPDLSLYHPWDIDAEQAIAMAMECEQAGRDVDARITNSEGATLSSHEGGRIYANSHGFVGSSISSRHSLSCTLIADDDRGMQRDYWYDIARDGSELESASVIGKRAADNTIRRLNARTIKTGSYPVIFAAEMAPSLFGQLIGAIRGGALYRKSSFLLDHLGKQIFPDFIHIHEQPYLLKALGSAAYDGEGVATKARDIIKGGILESYVLDSYSARKLKMTTTANSGGVRNLTVDSGEHDFNSLLKQLDTGIVVTETMGMGINIVTGDYSQGAAGFWVENGEIQYAIDEFTIANNLRDMFMGIQAVGNDVEKRGNTRTGSILLDNMMIAG